MLDQQQFFVKERVGFLKTASAYDIFHPTTQAKLGVAQEKPSLFMRMIFKAKAPTAIEVRDAADQLVFKVVKPLKLLGRPKISVVDAAGNQLGYFVSKMFAMGGGFHIYDPTGKHIGEVKGNWKAKDFTMLTPEKKELGRVSKQWAGMAKEFFTSADNYVVAVHDEFANDAKTKMLLLAAALTVDMLMYEG